MFFTPSSMLLCEHMKHIIHFAGCNWWLWFKSIASKNQCSFFGSSFTFTCPFHPILIEPFSFYLSTLLVSLYPLLVTKKLLHLWTLPALPDIKSCHFGIVAIVFISIIELIKFHVLFWNELFRYEWTLNKKRPT
jgi:hypothetical protein